MLEQATCFNEPINVSTKHGNAVILSEEDYNGLMETMYLLSDSEMIEKIKEARETTLSECIPVSEIEW